MMKIIDLSVPLENHSFDPWPPRIFYLKHRSGAKYVGKRVGRGVDEFPGKIGFAWEEVKLTTHTGTHLVAPWHFAPTTEGRPAKTIDEIPLDWCYGDGVVLDLTRKKTGQLITVSDLKDVLSKIDYEIKAKDIVLIRTDADKHFNKPDYGSVHSGVSREAIKWMIERGVKIIGMDGYGLDRKLTPEEDLKDLFQAHFVGREKEYCQIEQLANLDKIPKPYGFKVAVFPIKIEGASAGWVRAVALVP